MSDIIFIRVGEIQSITCVCRIQLKLFNLTPVQSNSLYIPTLDLIPNFLFSMNLYCALRQPIKYDKFSILFVCMDYGVPNKLI